MQGWGLPLPRSPGRLPAALPPTPLLSSITSAAQPGTIHSLDFALLLHCSPPSDVLQYHTEHYQAVLQDAEGGAAMEVRPRGGEESAACRCSQVSVCWIAVAALQPADSSQPL